MQRSWLGRRVSVRRAVARRTDGSPQLADVVGDLVDLDDERAVILGRAGPTTVPIGSITAARLVAASAGEELRLQDIAAGALRAADTAALDGWRLRAGSGRPRRVNSVLTTGRLDRPLDAALATARDWYGARGLSVLLQVPPHARRVLDAELAARGWAIEAPARVLVTAIDRLTHRSDAPVRIAATPDDAWLALHGGERELLVRHDSVAFASISNDTEDGEDSQVVAVARATIDAGWLGLTGLVVDPAHRRQGLAGAVMAALAGWAAGRGATNAYVQVERDNDGALALYERLGFWPHHDYHYRRAPVAPDQ